MEVASRTQVDSSQDAPEPTTIDLEPTTGSETTSGGAADGAPDPRDTELATLRQQNERYRQQMNGSSVEARRLAEEARASNDRIARLEGLLQSRQAETTPTLQQAAGYPKGKLKAALQKWVNGDETDLDEVEEALGRLSASSMAAHGPEPLKPEAIRDLIRNELRDIGSVEVVRSSVSTHHPEMADQQSPLYGAVYAAYDLYANDQTNRVIFPRDARFETSIMSPDGTESKTVDVRLVRLLASDVRAQQQTRSTRQEGVGQVQGAARGASGRFVDAWELFSEDEQTDFTNEAMFKGWPELKGKTPRERAKHIFQGLEASDQKRRIDGYKRSMRSLA